MKKVKFKILNNENFKGLITIREKSKEHTLFGEELRFKGKETMIVQEGSTKYIFVRKFEVLANSLNAFKSGNFKIIDQEKNWTLK